MDVVSRVITRNILSMLECLTFGATFPPNNLGLINTFNRYTNNLPTAGRDQCSEGAFLLISGVGPHCTFEVICILYCSEA